MLETVAAMQVRAGGVRSNWFDIVIWNWANRQEKSFCKQPYLICAFGSYREGEARGVKAMESDVILLEKSIIIDYIVCTGAFMS